MEIASPTVSAKRSKAMNVNNTRITDWDTQALPFCCKLTIEYAKLVQEEEQSAIHIETVTAIPTHTPEDYGDLQLQNQVSSPLFRLPRELRDIILGSVVDSSPPPLDARRSALPACLQVCHQLRDEFAQIFYARKLILAGGAPSPVYEKRFFDGFDEGHKKYVRRVHWLWDSYGTKEQAVGRAGQLDRLTGLKGGTWTVGFINVFEEGMGARARYVNAVGLYRGPVK